MNSLLTLIFLVVCIHGFQGGVRTTRIIFPRTSHYDTRSPALTKSVLHSSDCLLKAAKGSKIVIWNEERDRNSAIQYLEALWLYLSRTWFKWRKFVRARTERTTVYVLECENNKYYVGSTTNRKQRFKEHKSERGGSKWTRLNKPIRVLREYKRIPEAYTLGKEAQVTAEIMLEYGINNVRGAMFAESRDYNGDDIRALTGFIGHYNNLGYQDVEARLARELPPSKTFSKSKAPGVPRKKKKRKNDRCNKCGKKGHWAYECPEAWGSLSKDQDKA